MKLTGNTHVYRGRIQITEGDRVCSKCHQKINRGSAYLRAWPMLTTTYIPDEDFAKITEHLACIMLCFDCFDDEAANYRDYAHASSHVTVEMNGLDHD